jgi:quercetin dioxygenase-like cupin family protein
VKTLVKLLLPLLVAGLILAGCSSDNDDSSPVIGSPPPAAATSVANGITEVQRQVLAESTSDAAPGQVVQLTRVVIPVGEALATHFHPGPQLAVVSEGTLTYQIVKGEVPVTRAAGTPNAKVETARAGQTIELKPGDSLIEAPGMEHNAKNNGSVPIVLYLSSLFPQGAPPSSPVQ